MTVASAVTAPCRGFLWLLRHPKAWPWAILPSALGAVLAVIAFVVWTVHVDDLAAWLTQTGWLKTATQVVGYVLGLVVAALVYFLGCSVLAGPFNELLAEAVGKIEFGREPPARTRSWIVTTLASIGHEVTKLAGYLAAQAVALMCWIVIPGVGGVVHAAASALITIVYLGVDYFDYSMAVERLTFKAKGRFVAGHAAGVFAFGTGAFVWLMIPVLNLALHPSAVVGAALEFGRAGGTDGRAPSA